MKKTLIASLALLSAVTTNAQTKGATLNITPDTKYQHIDGFGGTGMNGQWADIYTKEKVDKLWGKGENQIGLNIMRVRINPNEGNWGEYGNAIKWAKAHGTFVFATPWTPPKKFKTDLGTTKKQNSFGTWIYPIVPHSWGGEGSNGGKINPAKIDEYAQWLENYRATMARKGCPIDMISIQNECDYTPTDDSDKASYESCVYTPQEMCQMVTAARKAIDPVCKVMGPETFGWGQNNYNYTLVKMADARTNIDVWGNHLYGSNDWSYISSVTAQTGKPMWMTEFLIDYAKSGWTWEQEYEMVRSLENSMLNGYSAYVYYNMLNDFFECAKGGSDTKLWKRAYIFGHYAKYATGKTRIESKLTDSYGNLVGGSTYSNETGDTITVFLLNPSKEEYAVRVILPWEVGNAKQIVTSASLNRQKTDVTDLYGGVTRPRVTIKPESFYTFQFTKNVASEDDVELAVSPKELTHTNPINPYHFMADPTAVEYNGRLYVYGTNDQQEFDYTNGQSNNTYGKIKQLVMMSTSDLVNWTYEGTIDVAKVCPWIWTSWAPSIVSREEADGKTHFYMYFTNSAAGIGVMTSTSPTGPWKDPLGHALIDGSTPGIGVMSNIIDPGALIDNNGVGWLTFGGGDVNKTGTSLLPGNARIVKLGSDMISLASEIKPIPAPFHFEANELTMVGDYYGFAYCTTWGDHTADWASYGSNLAAPSACSIVYMRTTDPLNGEWKYMGEIMKNPGTAGYPYGNNHVHMQEFKGTNYMIYHTQGLESALGLGGGYRSIGINQQNKTNVRISTITPKNDGITQLAVGSPVAEQVNYASCMANGAGIKEVATSAAPYSIKPSLGGWILVKGVKFSETERSITANLHGAGMVEVHVGARDNEPVAVIRFDDKDKTAFSVDLNSVIEPSVADVYFVFKSVNDVTFDSWQFSSKPASDVTAIESIGAPVHAVEHQYYNVAGQKLRAPQKGINIIDGKKVWVK